MKLVVAAALLLTSIGGVSSAAAPPGPLTGVKEVGVLVYLLHDGSTDGLDKTGLQEKAESDLKAAGINVLRYGQKARLKGPGVLVLTIDVVKWTGNPISSFNVRGDFMERAVVDRAGKPFIEDASTWQYANTGLVGDLDLKDEIAETVDFVAQLFAHQYAADNQKAVK